MSNFSKFRTVNGMRKGPKPWLTEREKFFGKAIRTPNGCWEWRGCCMKRNGYGTHLARRKQDVAHRWSYVFTFGEIPKGMHVCHSCDNPKCVNPDHLWLGTQWDNLHDMRLKKRDMDSVCPHTHARGSNVGRSRLTEGKVFQLRRIHLKGVQARRIADWVKMDYSGILNMLRGDSWAHVPFPRHENDTLEAHAA